MPMALVRSSQGEVHKNGETRNVSSTGVYFVISHVVAPGSLLEFVITLPDDVSISGPVRLLCKGKATRVEIEEDALVGVAATIERYEFMRDTVH